MTRAVVERRRKGIDILVPAVPEARQIIITGSAAVALSLRQGRAETKETR